MAKDFTPRRIYWSTITVFALFGMAGLALAAGAIWGLIKAVHYLPWIG